MPNVLNPDRLPPGRRVAAPRGREAHLGSSATDGPAASTAARDAEAADHRITTTCTSVSIPSRRNRQPAGRVNVDDLVAGTLNIHEQRRNEVAGPAKSRRRRTVPMTTACLDALRNLEVDPDRRILAMLSARRGSRVAAEVVEKEGFRR